MITKVEIENYKSLENLSIELGRFNVLIGENGCGKTNILESLIFSAAGAGEKVENDFIALRGGRVTEPQFYRTGFDKQNVNGSIKIRLIDKKENKLEQTFRNDNTPFSKWIHILTVEPNSKPDAFEEFLKVDYIKKYFDINVKDNEIRLKSDISANSLDESFKNELPEILIHLQKLLNTTNALNALNESGTDTWAESFPIYSYIIYAPENFFLRNVSVNETFVEPLGYKGEGLLRLIKVIKKENPEEYKEIIHHLHLIDWFENFEVNEDINADSEFTLSDKYLEDGLKSFDIRNANEGFLFVLFYLTIFISDYTPKFFAIDNIDTALNPKLCSKLISVLAELAKKHDKQVIITTHNPSVLDGLNLNDDEQRLFVIARNKTGRTRATRIEKKEAVNGTAPVKLSEQFLRGYIGGLPKNF